jgi:hypothetical protein
MAGRNWVVVMVEPEGKVAFAETEEKADNMIEWIEGFYFSRSNAPEFEVYKAKIEDVVIKAKGTSNPAQTFIN